ncbi:hypothetical protein PISMIDRAFT_690742 [Pisolithus microcarpus 441]|uniref:Uncharacterized protein n=1 Tax=Pisolithus microcarpus 441 TaxID=765257 RepID=A0A0C9Y9S4_9AGAM|nr:hypothetical protein PISMIDRAFT_690742 [Pisolithus microcarpus 441]
MRILNQLRGCEVPGRKKERFAVINREQAIPIPGIQDGLESESYQPADARCGPPLGASITTSVVRQ